MEPMTHHSVSVAAAIFDERDENVLLIRRRDNNHWEPPGGLLELRETFDDGLRREVREEAGLDIRVDHLTGVYKNMSRGVVALVFRCTALNRPQQTTSEASAVAWVPLHDVTNLMDPAYAIRILDATDSTRATFRAHDGTHLVDSGR
jgi:8-oxo-dGTP diphosphatase